VDGNLGNVACNQAANSAGAIFRAVIDSARNESQFCFDAGFSSFFGNRLAVMPNRDDRRVDGIGLSKYHLAKYQKY